MNLNELVGQITSAFEEFYGRTPRWIAAAPGRVNIIGEHTDYNDGFVLPMAIEYYTLIAADRRCDGQPIVTFRSTFRHDAATADLSQPIKPKEALWGNYPRGVVAGLIERGLDPGGLDVLIHSTVPPGSGLSSSAALEVATATVMEAVTGEYLYPVEKALLAQKAEHDFAGVPCGVMDQFISVLARKDHLLLLDCRTLDTEWVSMNDLSVVILIINTNVKHELSGGEYAERRSQCKEAATSLGVSSLRDVSLAHLELNKNNLTEVVYRRARHVISEIRRTLEAAEAVKNSDWIKVGELMDASHTSLREDYEVSCEELDAVVQIAKNIGLEGGVYGCRMTGGGFGGCCVALIKAESVESISAQIAAAYEEKTGIKPSLYLSKPAAGTMILKAGWPL